MNTTTINETRTLDLRECVARLIKAGMTEQQANAEIDVILMINEATSSTKAEIKTIDHRVDMIEIKLDTLNMRFIELNTRLSWGIGIIVSAVIGSMGSIVYALFKYLPVIAKLMEMSD